MSCRRRGGAGQSGSFAGSEGRGRPRIAAESPVPRRGARPKTQTEAFKASADDTKTGAAEGSRVRRKRRYGVVWVVHACTLPSYAVSPFIRVSMRVTSVSSALQI